MKKVLIVEDQPNLRLLLKDNLELDGMEVVCASTGGEALELAWKSNPSVAVVDIGLPDIPGWEVCRRLRADDRTKDIELVILTAESRAKVADKLEALSLKHFVSKPYDPIAVGRMIKEL